MKIPIVLATLATLLPVGLRADPTAADYKAELLAADTAFSANSAKEGVFQAFMDVATPDTKLLSEGGKGFDAVRSGYKDTPPTATLSWKPMEAQASSKGDMGYTWGRYEYRDRKADGKEVVETGTYVTIWRRQADGSWKVVLDGGEPDPRKS
jgi:ketosteroid isomerase-like protein